jgi:hypothetical protein
MSRHHTVPHIPRAHRDPIDGPDEALALLSVAVSQPLVPETVAVLLDGRRMGGTITVVSGTDDPDAVIDVVEVISMAAWSQPSIRSLVVASVRPHGATLPGDVDRWLEASAAADTFGLELLEWFVIGPAGAECPRDLLGEPHRW